jgi:hypothetical protein
MSSRCSWLAGLLLVGCGAGSMGVDTPNGGTGGSPSAGHAGGAGGGVGQGGVPGQGGGSGAGAGGSPAATTGTIRLVPNVVAGVQPGKGSTLPLVLNPTALRIGSPSALSLQSLKYYISSIQLCQDVTLQGSGYSGTQGCIQLYQNQAPGSPDYDTYLVTQAKDDTTAGRYIDLMTAEGQAALRKPITLEVPLPPPNPDAGAPDDAGNDPDSRAGDDAAVADDAASDPPAPPSQAGAYRFGLINFYRPIKVKAEFPVVGHPDQHFRTRAVTHITPVAPPMAGGFASERVEIGDTLSGPTEETTYMLNNGGALFTFQKPFVITREDIEAKAEIKIDLVFNPENFGQAYESQTCRDQNWVQICDPVNNVIIDMPYVRMNPVPRKTGEKTRKETYLMDYDINSKLRIELYYNDHDPEAGVQGVDTAIVYGPSATTPNNNVIASNFVAQIGSVRSNDASVTLMDYQHTPNLVGLRRRQNGTTTIHCLFTGAICPTPGGTVTRPYTYQGDTVVSTD